MNPTKLLEFFDSRSERGEALVLVTVVATEGSTYSKAGAQMLVDGNGIFRGMLSGGCLEGDLAIRAQQVLETGTPQVATYDLGSDNDELWGMGVGCDGWMRMVLQPIRPDDNYAPFDAIATIWRGAESQQVDLRTGVDGSEELEILVVPPPQVLLLGAGLDVEPVVRFAAELGWRCTVCDHRPAYVENGDFPGAAATHCITPGDLARSLDLDIFDASVVMSHHLASDRTYLSQLAESAIPYIGLLGPINRRERLLDELGEFAPKIVHRLHAPVGLNLGGRGPAPIALAIIAELQQFFASR